MKIESLVFRSRLAQRIVALFVVCAVVPIVTLAALSLLQVRAVFSDHARRELTHVAQDYTSNLHDRLDLADQELAAAAERGVREAWPFASIRYMNDASIEPSAPGDAAPDAREPRKAPGQAVIVVRSAGTDAGTVEIVRALPGTPRGRRVRGVVDAEFLWGDASDLPSGIDLCVLLAGGQPVFCTSKSDVQRDVHTLDAQSSGAVSSAVVDAPGGAVLVSRRDLFLPRFNTAGWTVLTWRPQADALAPTAAFVALFIPVAVLALLLAALLSTTQIRRTLGPLHALLAGTRKAAEQDFSSRVDEHAHDEFGQLGAAFNAMNERLGQQFETLRTLATIDRGILSRSAVDCTVEMVLQRLEPLLPARYVAVAMLDRHGGSTLRVFSVDHAAGNRPALERLDAGNWDATAWLGVAREIALDHPEADNPLVRALPLRAAHTLIGVPILADTAAAGALLIGCEAGQTLSAEQRRHAGELADRLGVALATAAKDEELYYQAHFDSLTTLPNRLQFMEELGRRMAHARREHREVALLFIDLDHFKDINDTAGHALGDAVLREAADRLRHCVRSGDALARLGGDEFTVIVSDMSTPRTPEVVAGHVLEAMAVPFSAGAGEHFLSASIGIAIHPADGATPEALLRNADTAMYRAKEAGRNRAVYFEERMNAAAQARVNIERDLRRGLDAAEFQLVYQPQFELATGRLVAAEALLRWHHPDGQVLLPGAFISRAEETGVIERLGLWVLQEACRQHQRWSSDGIVLDRMALNVSPQQLRRREFVGEVTAALRASGMPARSLELEITESVLMDPGRHVELALATLDSMRVQVALDDFGTGYSSLAYVKRFPVHVVKIDRAFIADLHREASSLAISSAIVGMAHALGKTVVAEGVENAAQAALLRDMRCDFVQGFYYGPPLSADAFTAMVRGRSAEARPPELRVAGSAGREQAATGTGGR